MEVKTLDVGGSFRYAVGSLLFVVLCCEQREFRVASRAALVVEDGQDLTACYAIEPASVNISSCYRLWHVCLLYWQSAVGFRQRSVSVGNRGVFAWVFPPSYKELLTAISQRLLVSLATELLDFVNRMLDGNIA